MKIKKFAGGGITYLATTNRREEGAKQASSDSSKKNNDYIKKILDMVTESGIDSDVAQFINSVKATLDLAADPMGNDMTMQDILNIARQASLVKTNYTEYQKARESLDSQDAWNDVALDSRGNLYVYDSEDGNINTVSLSKLKENPGRYQVLNNSDIMSLRRNDKSMAFNTGILDNIMSSAGMTSIVNYAKDIIGSFKDTQISGYSSKTSGNINTGMQSIVSALLNGNNLGSLIVTGPDGLYKVSSKSTIADTHIQDALNYIKISMPENYRHKLRATAALNGYTEDAYLLTSLMANTGRELTATYEENIDPVTGKKPSKDSTSTKTRQVTLAEQYVTGQGLPNGKWYTLQSSGSKSGLKIYGQDVGNIMRASGENGIGDQMSDVSLAYILENAYGIGKISNRSITFGNQVIDPNHLDGIVYDNSEMLRVVLPYKLTDKGEIVPDFDTYKEIEKVVEANKNSPESVINRYLQEVLPGTTYDKETKSVRYPEKNSHVFLTFRGVASNLLTPFTPDMNYMVKSDKNKEVYKEAAKFGSANHDKNAVPRFGESAEKTGFWNAFKGVGSNLYEANVFIPIRDDLAGVTMYNRESVPESRYSDVAQQYEDNKRRVTINDEFKSGERKTNW